jgi:hypothetical protein
MSSFLRLDHDYENLALLKRAQYVELREPESRRSILFILLFVTLALLATVRFWPDKGYSTELGLSFPSGQTLVPPVFEIIYYKQITTPVETPQTPKDVVVSNVYKPVFDDWVDNVSFKAETIDENNLSVVGEVSNFNTEIADGPGSVTGSQVAISGPGGDLGFDASWGGDGGGEVSSGGGGGTGTKLVLRVSTHVAEEIPVNTELLEHLRLCVSQGYPPHSDRMKVSDTEYWLIFDRARASKAGIGADFITNLKTIPADRRNAVLLQAVEQACAYFGYVLEKR